MPSQDVSIKGEGTNDFVEVAVDVDTSEISLSSKSNIYGWDEDSGAWLKLLCDESGRLITSAFTRPADTLDIGENYQATVTKNTIVSTGFTIPNGKSWRLQQFGGGSFANKGKISIYFDGTLIRSIYVNSSSFEVSIDEAYDGDGAKQITIELDNQTNQSNEMFGYFTGFEQ
jgi:hypothetical protein